jgi:V8-like Glu-specific endopeptidase
MNLTVFPATRRRAALVSALALFAFALVLAPRAAAGAGPAAVQSHSIATSAAQVKRIKQYWTPRRMRQATPVDDTVSRGEVAHTASAATPRPASRATAIPPTLGRAPSPSNAKVPKANLISDPTVYPYRTQGKVFFRWKGGAYVCSATVVNTPSLRVIFSAGHCAVDEGTWSKNFAFVPGYHNGYRPYGTYVATKLYSINGWIDNENFSYDMSAAVLGGTKKVGAVVGSRGITFNAARQQSFVSFGYPAGFPFSGERLYNCPSPYRGQDNTTTNPRTQWITCNMTGGSSGGGWIIQGQYLNSVNSYGYNGLPNRMYGPYFGAAAQNLYNQVKNQAP